jgi:hypothetical protein
MLECFAPMGVDRHSVGSHFKESWNPASLWQSFGPSEGRVLTIIESAALRL